MNGTLEGLGVPDITMTYLRHLVIAKYGHTRERDVAEKIKTTVTGKVGAIEFLGTLAESAQDYVAIASPNHPRWNVGFGPKVREAINTLGALRVTVLRPLMLSIARRFTPKEVEKAFRLLVAWSVRLLVVGGGRSGKVEEGCADLAKRVTDGAIKKAGDLVPAAEAFIPSDAAFRADFEAAKVATNSLARYYLRSLELKRGGADEPELIPNESTVINLEHVLPESPTLAEWQGFDDETAELYWRRLGNMVLLQASKNTAIGNKPFSKKRPVLQASQYTLTAEVGAETDWTPIQINERQKRLAQLAVSTWPIVVP